MINVLIQKYFPDSDETTSKFLMTYLKMKSLGLGNLELLMKDENLEEIVINQSKEPVWVFHKKYGWLKTTLISFYADVPTASMASTANEKRLLGYRDYKFPLTDGLHITGSAGSTISVILRPCNRFYHPMGMDTLDPYSSSSEL
jgi:Flp pilus assembly CpaF family ATPase